MNSHIFFIILKFLLVRKRQTLVSIMGVSIGVAAFVVMASLMNGFQKHFIQQAIDLNAHITVKVKPVEEAQKILEKYYGKGAEYEILGSKPKEELDKIVDYRYILERYSKEQSVLGISPHLTGQAIIKYGIIEKPATMVGIEPALERRASVIDKFIVNKKLDTLVSDRNSIIIGKLLAKDLGIHEIGRKVLITAPNGNTRVFKVVDFFDSGITSLDQTRVYINLRTLQSLLDKPDQINEIILKLKDVNLAEKLSKQITLETGYYAESWQRAYRNFLQLFKIQNYITYMIVFAILIVSAFGIFNIIMMTVMDKRKDISILKAMGFESIDIIRIFTYQGVFIGFLGAIFGLLIGYLIQNWLASINIDVEGIVRTKGFVLDRSPVYYFYGVIFAFLFSFIASFYPSYRAAKLNPVDIFRSGA